MNKIMEVAELLGFEPYEEFSIGEYEYKFRFTDSELQLYSSQQDRWVQSGHFPLAELIYGAKIIRLPYQPKTGETYWTYYEKEFTVVSFRWMGTAIDYALLNTGMAFRTREIALQNKAKKYKELTGKDLQE